jgi:hypothetical protein
VIETEKRADLSAAIAGPPGAHGAQGAGDVGAGEAGESETGAAPSVDRRVYGDTAVMILSR